MIHLIFMHCVMLKARSLSKQGAIPITWRCEGTPVSSLLQISMDYSLPRTSRSRACAFILLPSSSPNHAGIGYNEHWGNKNNHTKVWSDSHSDSSICENVVHTSDFPGGMKQNSTWVVVDEGAINAHSHHALKRRAVASARDFLVSMWSI